MGQILIAISHESLRDSLRAMLQPHVDSVATADTVDALLHSAQAVQPDAVIVDLMLGRDILRVLREQLPDIPVILLTMHDEPAVAQHALRNGATAVVCTLDATTELPPAIASVLRGS